VITEKGSKLVFISHGAVLTSSQDSPQARLKVIYTELKQIFLKHRPQAVAIEKLFFGANTKTAIAVGQARGISLLLAAELKIPVAEYTPLEVKMALTGYGRAEKKQIQQMVKTLLNLPAVPKPDDAADALAIAITHLHSYKLLRVASRESPV
jgi:crossover junction endodeoxyribonuclease RuvC